MSEEDRYEMSQGNTFICEVCGIELPSIEIEAVRDQGYSIKICVSCKPKILAETEKTMRMDIAKLWSDSEMGDRTVSTPITEMIRALELCYVAQFEEQDDDKALGLKLAYQQRWGAWNTKWY